jgi:HAD superfamily hydrolase (TIGR01549 family)
MNLVQAICLDLDDTLWDLGPVIPRAERTLYDWFGENYPDVLEKYSPDDVLQLRQQTALANPGLRHDLTALRMLVLRGIARNSGYAESMAEEAFHVFDQARNQVELYADVVPALERLGARYRLLTLSNGNASLQKIGIAHHFAGSYSARELGLAKPEPGIFNAVCELEQLLPEQMLHVGDHPENDIVAARSVGMAAVWVNREGISWPLEGDCPVATVACLEELADVLGV